MYLSILLREHSRNSPKLLSTLTFVRSMGGGPRTFPGGLNKWQWKRLHEKKAKEKENRLLDQEKQLYQARIRSQIRAQLAGQPDKDTKFDPNYSPMTANEHIKALADRFMKPGAEDLWNEADGPIKSSPSRPPPTLNNRSIRTPIDLRKLISESDKTQNSMNWNDSLKPRHYSVYTRSRKGSRFNFRRNESSTSEDDSDSEDGLVRQSSGGDASWMKFGSKGDKSDDFSDKEEEEMKGGGNVKRLMSSAALGKYDTKKTRRVPLKFLEQEENLSEHIEAIKKEFNKRNLMENAVDKSDEDSILSQKRFDECNVSPLTVKALTQAGYVQMTRVQEATLSVCLEGKDSLVKAKTGTGKSAAFLF